MTRLIKSVRLLDSSVTLSGGPATPARQGSGRTESSAVSEALRQLPSPAVAIEAVARQIEAQMSSVPVLTQREIEHLAEVEIQAKEKGHEEGYGKGYEEGRTDATVKLEQAWKDRLARVDSLLEALEQARRACDEAVEDIAVAVAFESVAKIVGRKSVSIEIIREMIAGVRREGGESGPIVVRVGSDDYEALVGEPFVVELEEERGRIRLVEDPRVAFGGCIIETPRGSIDARSEMQLDRLQKILIEARRAEES